MAERSKMKEYITALVAVLSLVFNAFQFLENRALNAQIREYDAEKKRLELLAKQSEMRVNIEPRYLLAE
jgi:hypothetical protein